MNRGLANVQAVFTKGRGTKNQVANIHWIIKKSKRVPEKHLFLLYWLCQSLWLCGSQQTVGNSKEMGIPDHLTCLLRNLYAGQLATGRTERGTTDWFLIGKGVHQGFILSPAYLTCMQSTSCEMLGWMKHKLESRLLGEISIDQICRWYHPYGRKWRTKEPLDESESEEWKSWLKT